MRILKMKIFYFLSMLTLIFGSCKMNEDSKKFPGTHGPPYHLHAEIWNSDSLNFEPMEAMVTIDSIGITRIESWDGERKTRDEVFKTLKVKWDGVGGSGTFKMFNKNYAIQVLDDIDDVYSTIGNFRKPDSVKK